MKIIFNNILPAKGFLAINLFGLLFVRGKKGDVVLKDSTINHEQIHTAQMKEMFYIFFYLWYIIEWIIRLFQYETKNNEAYYAISFEKEAYTNEQNCEYLKNRKPYSWIKHL